MMKFGLLDTEIENIHKIFSQNQEIEKVIIFGFWNFFIYKLLKLNLY